LHDQHAQASTLGTAHKIMRPRCQRHVVRATKSMIDWRPHGLHADTRTVQTRSRQQPPQQTETAFSVNSTPSAPITTPLHKYKSRAAELAGSAWKVGSTSERWDLGPVSDPTNFGIWGLNAPRSRTLTQFAILEGLSCSSGTHAYPTSLYLPASAVPPLSQPRIRCLTAVKDGLNLGFKGSQ
jgi:hypothetical protein